MFLYTSMSRKLTAGISDLPISEKKRSIFILTNNEADAESG